jgi:hypothetical protein
MYQLLKPLKTEGGAELWLGSLLKAIQQSVRNNVRAAALATREPGFQLVAFIDAFLAQVKQTNQLTYLLCSVAPFLKPRLRITDSHLLQILQLILCTAKDR